MAVENEASSTTSKAKKRKHYLPHNKPVKKKGSYPLRPGVQGFFITCDGGRERQASHEAINVIDSFYEEIIDGSYSGVKIPVSANMPLNKKIKFSYSDSSSHGDSDDDYHGDGTEEAETDTCRDADANNENPANGKDDSHEDDKPCHKSRTLQHDDNQENGLDDRPTKKQCQEMEASTAAPDQKKEEKSIAKLIDAEVQELGDKNKRRFINVDSGCNGVIFVQMRKRDGDPCPKEIVQHIMQSAASTKKHVSRFILRLLPIEVTCYASEEEISKAIKPLVEHYFPAETQNPQKFAVLYEARANSGIDRMKIINSVAKSIPGPHKVDLNNPDRTIAVQIIKTVCLIGVVEKYKELAKFNLRQLTAS